MEPNIKTNLCGITYPERSLSMKNIVGIPKSFLRNYYIRDKSELTPPSKPSENGGRVIINKAVFYLLSYQSKSIEGRVQFADGSAYNLHSFTNSVSYLLIEGAL